MANALVHMNFCIRDLRTSFTLRDVDLPCMDGLNRASDFSSSNSPGSQTHVIVQLKE